MLSTTTPYARDLGNNLVLKSVSTPDEIERLAAFNLATHNERGIDAMTRELILRHPHTHPRHWLFVEDTSTGETVSSIALIPWQWQYEDVTLRVGEMGIVGTNEAYRHRGLIRALVERFKELLAEGEYDLSHIQGIPYYYRQFGYEYALPLERKWHVELHALPADPPAAPRPTIRLATPDDIPALMRHYAAMMRSVDIHTVRDEPLWRYLLNIAPMTATAHETWLAVDAAQQIVGYWRIDLAGFGQGLNVAECSPLPYGTAAYVLHWLKQIAIDRGKPYIRLNLPAENSLVQTARGWGAHDMGHYAWQIHVPDAARLLHTLAPIFERRVACSMFAGLTRTVRVSLYRETIEMRFVDGMIKAVESVGFSEGGDISLPPLLLAPLALGYRTWRDLREMYPDVSCWEPSSQPLIDTLFPRAASFITQIY
ncbi:MAG TPA: GNAT family N-acetyltransferase [Aggregatilinea sp.]|uniref:GNAT family N-acetyltransferase n=1 Tax=Aggregatilinea sp. TaxID=2806333 RepID=UPI002B7B7972|nr:GNAT family N-acetyltransferase [Aggregatilinea sp.]HML22519.1 GNAT family N-acetyltransferase [Aggregatilinea sp.]